MIFWSCATLFSNREVKVLLTSNNAKAKVRINDSIYNLPANVYLKRSREDFKFIFLTDSIDRNHVIKSKLSGKFWVGNLFFGSPISYVIDLKNDKRFTYNKSVFIDTKDASLVVKKMPFVKSLKSGFAKSIENQKGIFKFSLSMPYINSFIYRPIGYDEKSSTGFLGVSAGLAYFYKSNNFIELKTSAITDFPIPVPAPIEYSDDSNGRQNFSSVSFDVTNNTQLNRFTYGYGLSYESNRWNYFKSIYSNDEFHTLIEDFSIKTINKNVGFVLNGYFELGDKFNLGLIYRPSIINLNQGVKFNYEHTISLDLQWKFNLNKIK